MKKEFDVKNAQDLYWLGFIATDGYVGEDRLVSIDLKASDLPQVERFIEFMGSKAKPYYRKTRNTFRGRVGATKIIHQLYSLGITPDKTKNLCVSSILKESKEFWLGVMDGDGYFNYGFCKNGWKQHHVTLTTASKLFAQQFLEYLESLNIKGKIYYHKQSNTFKAGICNKVDCDKFLNTIYSSEVVSLERKFSKYLNLSKEG